MIKARIAILLLTAIFISVATGHAIAILLNQSNRCLGREHILDTDAIIQACRYAIEDNPAHYYYEMRADAHRRQGHFDSAIDDANAAIRAGSHSRTPYDIKFMSFVHEKYYTTAMEHEKTADIDKLTEAVKKEPFFLRSRAWAFVRQEKFDRAIVDFTSASTQSLDSFAGLAEIYLLAKDYEKGRAACKSGNHGKELDTRIVSGNDSALLWFICGNVFIALGQRDYGFALMGIASKLNSEIGSDRIELSGHDR